MSTKKKGWARDFYQLQRERNKSHHAAVRALAFKWLRIVFRCWKERIPYDELRYVLATKKHAAQKSVEIQFKNVAGFSKLGGFSC
jgi:hypothetical protein